MKKDWQKFESFLKREGVYEKYMENCKNQGEIKMEKIPKFLFLMRSFIWEITPEGDNFWEDINCKWKIELNNDKSEFSVNDIIYLMEKWVEVRSEVEDEEFDRITDSGNQIGDTFFEDVENIALNKILNEIRNNKTE